MATKKKAIEKPLVLVRTYSAGVHFGELVRRNGKELTLRNARRIWYWVGANTLHEISLRGVSVGSKISDEVPEITLTEAIEIIPIHSEAAVVLAGIKWE